MTTRDTIGMQTIAVAAPGKAKRWGALYIIVLAAFMTTLDDFIVFVALPAIQRDLHASAAELQWVVAGYVLAYGVAVVSGGRLGDIYGHKRMFLLGTAGFTLFSLLCGVAPNILFLLVARVFEGILAAVMFPQVFSLIKHLFPEKEQPMAMGILGAVIGIAAIGGQLFGGILLGLNIWGLTWRPIFFVNVPIGVLALFAAAPLLRESRSQTTTRVDGPGVLFASISLLLIVYPLVQGHDLGWPLWLLVAPIVAIPAIWLFVRYERHRTAKIGSPLLELSLFRNLLFTRSIGVLLLETALGSGLFFVLALYLQVGHHFSAFDAGLAFTPMAITYTVGSLATSYLTRLLGTRILGVGILIASFGTLLTVAVITQAGNGLSILSLLPLAVMGFGNALVATPLPGFIIAVVGKDAVGAASGAISTAQQLGAALGVALIGIVFFAVGQGSGYTPAFASSLLYYILPVCLVQFFLVAGLPVMLNAASNAADTHSATKDLTRG